MTGYAIEALALLLLIALGWRIWRAGAGAAAYGTAGTLLALLAAAVVVWATAALVAWCCGNLVVRLAVPLGLSVVAFALMRRWWLRNPRRREAWSAACSQRPIVARATLVAVLATHVGLIVLLAAVTANLIVRRWPEADSLVREQTAVMRHLLVGVPRAIAADPVRLAIKRQRQLAGRLGRVFASGRDAVADATGISAALEAIDILREIGDLDYGPKLWLVRNHPALARLIDHRGLRAVATDAAVLDEVARVANGSLAAAWRLGDRADIQALFADPEIGAALRAIRLAELRAAWRARTAEGEPVPVAWRVQVGGPDAAWSEEPDGLETFASGPPGSVLVARGTLPGEDVARYRLMITGLVAPQLMVGNRLCALAAVPGGWSAEITVQVAGGDLELGVEATAPDAGLFGLALTRLAAE